jgi:hypothetical protein
VSACISAVQHMRPLRGGSQSQLLRASDGQYYVTKFQNNPQHVRVLANEMLATRLGQLLGLPVPRVTAIEVCDWLIAHTDGLRMDAAGLRTPFKPGRLSPLPMSAIPPRVICSTICLKVYFSE